MPIELPDDQVKGDAKKFEGAPLNFADDFTGPKLNIFWKTSGAPKERYVFTQEPETQQQALRITVEPLDGRENGDNGTFTERTEIKEASESMIPPETDAWYGFSLFVPQDFKIINNRLVIAQWRQIGDHLDNPSMALRYINGELLFTVQEGSQRRIYKAPPLPPRQWNRLTVHHKVGKDAQGECSASLNGVTFATHAGRIGYPQHNPQLLFRMGAYRDEVSHSDTLYFAKFRRGDSESFANSS